MNHYLKTKKLILFSLLICLAPLLNAQEVGIKTNLPYWATTSPNLGLEFALSEKSSLEISGGLNPFEYADNKRFKHWLIQPEFRWWLCETFNGHFLGLHAHVAQYNVGGWDIPIGRLAVFENNRYQGYLYGGGLSYGYQWVLSNRFNLEFNIGAGYAHVEYDKYPCTDCGTKEDEGTYNYWGVTRVGLSFIYFIK